MNYRHHFHAGNFADVMKHALLVALFQNLQRKEKGFLYLDTHAGRGRYDLELAATGDSLARKPEWPEGIGRLWTGSADSAPPALAGYLRLVREFDRESGNRESAPRFYPGSPWLARQLARTADRIALFEKHPAEAAALRAEFAGERRVAVHESDGYAALRALLPPRERRGLVLIDPPYEAQDEFAQIAAALAEGLDRFPTGVFAVWYPLTERARVEEFLVALRKLKLPATCAVELAIAGETAAIKMKGCGLLVVNSPWQFAETAGAIAAWLAPVLRQEPGATGRTEWIAREAP